MGEHLSKMPFYHRHTRYNKDLGSSRYHLQ